MVVRGTGPPPVTGAVRRTPPRRVLAAAVAVAITVAGAGLGVILTRPHSESRWTQVWAGSLAGPAGAAPSQQAWHFSTGQGGFGNGEIETATSSRANVHLGGHGAVDITASGQGTSWTSGRIQSRQAFRVPSGSELMVTASVRQPGPAVGTGYWPAVWLLGAGPWPAHGEIDILEDVNGLSEHSGALHCGNLTTPNPDGTFGPCHEQNGLSSGLQPCPGCQQAYHAYAVIIDRRDPAHQQVRWYLDGHQFFSVAESRTGTAAWNTAFSQGFTVILDLAIGGTYPDTVCGCSAPAAATTSGGTMSVRNVQVYQAA